LFTFEQLFENDKCSPNFRATLFRGKSDALFSGKKRAGLLFGQFFNKLIWSPWPPGRFGSFLTDFLVVFAQPAGHLQVNPGLPDFINTYNIPK
jgi:hypothetical protein